METWTKDRPTDAYIGYLRQIIEYAIAKGQCPSWLPRLITWKAISRLTGCCKAGCRIRYSLWNFWKAADPLPYHGLTSDNFHLTNGPNSLASLEHGKSLALAQPDGSGSA